MTQNCLKLRGFGGMVFIGDGLCGGKESFWGLWGFLIDPKRPELNPNLKSLPNVA